MGQNPLPRMYETTRTSSLLATCGLPCISCMPGVCTHFGSFLRERVPRPAPAPRTPQRAPGARRPAHPHARSRATTHLRQQPTIGQASTIIYNDTTRTGIVCGMWGTHRPGTARTPELQNTCRARHRAQCKCSHGPATTQCTMTLLVEKPHRVSKIRRVRTGSATVMPPPRASSFLCWLRPAANTQTQFEAQPRDDAQSTVLGG